ncbi:MAG: chorismate synthase [Lachnospiraceae bacterium]|nr:chorismate synthase [Lachnospiraceae bacterium]
MAGSTIGTLFKITTWGESHGAGVGVVIDGCPSGLPLDEDMIQQFLNRRRPGQTPFSTPRKEDDQVRILSGVFEGKTTGTPISLMVENTSARPRDYSQIASCYRPGHADYCFDRKYGFRDYRGGGRSSGRETIGRVAAGAVAVMILERMGISFTTFTKAIGPILLTEEEIDLSLIGKTSTGLPNASINAQAESFLKECMMEKDSAGGVVECRVAGLPVGLGEPVFDKLDACLAKAILSIGAVKAFELGEGTNAPRLKGSENNDPFRMVNGNIQKLTNHAGGTLGGMSDGSELILRAHIKPTSSIFSPQQTVTKDGEEVTIQIKGRHDPVIVPRAVVVVEAMTALTLLDLLMINMTARLDSIVDFYGR